MGKPQEKAHLSPNERKQVAELYKQGGESYRTLADRFGVSRSTIKRIVHKSKEQPTETVEPIEYIADPIEFRRAKLTEINGDIMSTRIRGSVQVLPALHRLHLQVHDELTTMKHERDQLDTITNPDELLQTIAIAVQGLPPLLRDQLIDTLNTNFENVIQFKT